ncbi:NAD(P)-dependent oxidoreductase [Nonomuraea deserti]|uniref:NAD(P)-dependent oxidoreductase n=1 Tax=Nonomuraea deserti TaxID=1848322 RepID=A0A4R4V2Z1_9ACTN|nr:NAD(P)-dependent oxidoreductase [Nonomuraea deserti]TDC99488.1 NAD(P)-dependent oxidoreductase [Nonomuraea deserti]
MNRSGVAITGGGGRLGGELGRRLSAAGYAVTLIDTSFPAWLHGLSLGVRMVELDLLSTRAQSVLRRALEGSRVVLHLAGLHGLHLRQGMRIPDIWRSNVEGTWQVCAASMAVGVERVVLASTTALYGPGSLPGEHAMILDEQRAPMPDNPYATAKLAAESIMASTVGSAAEGVSLRLGRFYREDESSYQLRKLSTGLDLEDAADAFVAVCEAARLPCGVYCVASDLPLPTEARLALGKDCRGVLKQHLPGFVDEVARRGWSLPPRVGRSVDSSKLQSMTRYRPRRSLATLATKWRAEMRSVR